MTTTSKTSVEYNHVCGLKGRGTSSSSCFKHMKVVIIDDKHVRIETHLVICAAHTN